MFKPFIKENGYDLLVVLLERFKQVPLIQELGVKVSDRGIELIEILCIELNTLRERAEIGNVLRIELKQYFDIRPETDSKCLRLFILNSYIYSLQKMS
ncbi:hypothetical protein ES703_75319 [subsurface metagenome]